MGARLISSSPRPFFRRRHLADKIQEVLAVREDGKALEALVDYLLTQRDLDQFPAPKPAKMFVSRVPRRLRVYS